MDTTSSVTLGKELILQFLQDAGRRVVCEVARILYCDETDSEGGNLSIREYCEKAKLRIEFHESFGPLLDNGLPSVDFDTSFAFLVIEKVCVSLYSDLNKDCIKGLDFLKKLLSEFSISKVFCSTDTIAQIDEFKTVVRAIYKGVSFASNQDLNRNLLTIDQMANNILYNYRKASMQSEKPLPLLSKGEDVESPHLAEIATSMSENPSNQPRRINQAESSIKQDQMATRETNIVSQEKVENESVKQVEETIKSSLRTVREKRHPEKISEGRRELIAGYSRLKDFNACACFNATNTLASKDTHISNKHLPLENIFTNLRVRNGLQEVEMKQILDLPTKNEEEVLPPLLLLQGLAGSGKTSLAYHFVSEWEKKESEVNSINDFDLVILVEASRVRSNRLKEFLRDELLPKTTSNMLFEDIVPWLKTLDLLFIFDGYYEIENVSYDILEDVLAKFGDQRIIVTTRPEVHKDFICMARRYQMNYLSLEVCGFDVPRLKDFTYKVLKVIESDEKILKKQAEEFLAFINARGRVLDKHLKLPLTILLLLFLWRDEPEIFNKDSTATRLYELLYILYFNILAESTSKYFKGASEIPSVLNSLLLYIGEKAWDMVKAGISEATDAIHQAIKEECSGKGIRPRELFSALHMYQIDNHSAIVKLPVAFHHNTQMYYLAGTYLVDRMQRNVLSVQDINACPGIEHVLMFVMGHLAEQNALTNAIVTEVQRIINTLDIEPTKYEFWWSMLLESKFQSQMGYYIAKEKLPKKNWQLNEVTVVRGLKLLALTPVKLWSLIIDIPTNKEPCDISEFFESLLETGKQLKKRQKRLVKVDLHLWNHEKNSIKSSDDFLRALHPWADLQSFVGHLGKQDDGEEIFSTYINLRVLKVRVSTMNSFHSLSSSLRKISKAVKTLHVTIALPKLSPPEFMTDLKTSGNLEISVADMEDQHREWLVEVIHKVSGKNGCWRLNLLNSRLTYDTVEWLVNRLKGRVHDKINIETK